MPSLWDVCIYLCSLGCCGYSRRWSDSGLSWRGQPIVRLLWDSRRPSDWSHHRRQAPCITARGLHVGFESQSYHGDLICSFLRMPFSLSFMLENFLFSLCLCIYCVLMDVETPQQSQFLTFALLIVRFCLQTWTAEEAKRNSVFQSDGPEIFHDWRSWSCLVLWLFYRAGSALVPLTVGSNNHAFLRSVRLMSNVSL